MRVYIAGPYTKGDVAMNVRNAIEAGDRIAKAGHFPFIPHMTHFWHMLFPNEYRFWMNQDREWLLCCDALVRLPGESSGADEEIEEFCKIRSTLVFFGVDAFLEYVRK